jgi:hypothetical protein
VVVINLWCFALLLLFLLRLVVVDIVCDESETETGTTENATALVTKNVVQ